MQPILIYLISFGSAIGGLALWKLFHLVDTPTRRIILSHLRKKLIYCLVLRRRRSTSNINVLALLNIVLAIVANLTACTVRLSNSAELAKRCGALFLVNAVPLYLGGRTSLFADRVLGIPLTEYHLFHRWIGRICILQGLVHGIINVSTAPTPSAAETLLISLLAALGGFSFLYIRRCMYELFLKTHLLFALVLVGILWFHFRITLSRTTICLGVASGLWLFQHVVWLARLIYRNSTSNTSNNATVTRFLGQSDSDQAADVTIKLAKPWDFSPGQYVYLTVPGMARHRGGFMQAHPYTVAWFDDSTITLLIQRGKGFSDAVFSASLTQSSIIVDGPYGKAVPLDSYDRVLFMASGIGIAAHLLYIRHLLEAHEEMSSRVRRLTLVWFLHTLDQEEWAIHFVYRLKEMDRQNIFTVALFIPPGGNPGHHLLLEEEKKQRWVRTESELNISSWIDREYRAEAGNMAVSVCGPPSFEDSVRRGIFSDENDKNDIYLFTAGCWPEETHASRMSRSRLLQ